MQPSKHQKHRHHENVHELVAIFLVDPSRLLGGAHLQDVRTVHHQHRQQPGRNNPAASLQFAAFDGGTPLACSLPATTLSTPLASCPAAGRQHPARSGSPSSDFRQDSIEVQRNDGDFGSSGAGGARVDRHMAAR